MDYLKVSNNLVLFNKVCDFIPFVSTINNVICLLAKAAFFLMNCCFKATYKKIKDISIVKYIEQKNSSSMFLLCFPGLNILIAIGDFLVEGIDKKEQLLKRKERQLINEAEQVLIEGEQMEEEMIYKKNLLQEMNDSNELRIAKLGLGLQNEV